MARRTGIATKALFAQASRHARLTKYLSQGNRRAVQRSVKASQDTKAREVKKHYNLGRTEFQGVNAIKRRFRTRLTVKGRMVEALEHLVAPAGIPLRDYGARKVKKGMSFSIVRGKRHLLKAGFSHTTFAGGHIFRRARSVNGRLAGRLPIDKRFGPGLPYLMKNREVNYQGRQRYQRRIAEELEKEEARAYKRAKL